jgi:hypothetical protein
MLRLATAMALICLVAPPLLGQAHFQSQTSGNWQSPSTWTIIAGSDANGIPDADDTVDVVNATSVTVGNSTANCAFLQVKSGGALLMNGSGNVLINANAGSATIYGTVTISGSGTLLRSAAGGSRSLLLKNGGKITMSGSAPNPTFDSYTYESASTFEYTAAASQDVLSGVVYGNLTLGGSGTKTVAPIPIDTNFTAQGKLTIASGVILDVSTSILRIYFNGDVENSGTINASVGITVLWMRGAHWVNNGTYLPSRRPGYGLTPLTTFSNCELSGTPVAQTLYNVAIEGTTTTLMNLSVDSNFTITSGATFNAGTGLSHQVKGNWTNSGTFNAGTSTITFNGTTTQQIGASAFNNLIFNNAAGATLTGDVSSGSSGTVTLTSGTLTTGSQTLSITSTSPSALVLGSNKIIGTVSRAIAPGSTSQYLFSGSTAYVIPGGTGNPTTLTLAPHPATNPPYLGPAADTNKMAKRYYTLTASGVGGGFTYTLRLPYEQSEVRGNESLYMLWQYTAGVWTNLGSSPAADTTNNHVGQSGITSTCEFAIAEDMAALPVELVSFTGDVLPGSTCVRLKWTTATEVNNFGFYVQRSSSRDGQFNDLPDNFIPGSGSSLVPKQYSWTDASPLPGTGFYRLKQVDLDGTVDYSPTIQVIGSGTDKTTTPADFSLSQNYPNPFNPSTTIEYTLPPEVNQGAGGNRVLLAVYDLLGRQVTVLVDEARAPGTYRATLDGSRLSSGTYICRLVAGRHVETRKMVLAK